MEIRKRKAEQGERSEIGEEGKCVAVWTRTLRLGKSVERRRKKDHAPNHLVLGV
jgi:hypothetical protein